MERPGSLQVAVDEVGAVVVEEGARGWWGGGGGGGGAGGGAPRRARPRPKYKVFIGQTQDCNCDVAVRGKGPCVHVLFAMLKVLRVPRDDPMVWQTSLTETEIQRQVK